MNIARPYQLDCGHEIWYKIPANPGDPVFCTNCGTETNVVSHDPIHGTFYPMFEWTCYKISDRISKGVCLNCGYEYRAEFKRLRVRMERHHIRGCDKPELPAYHYEKLPPNSPPPF